MTIMQSHIPQESSPEERTPEDHPPLPPDSTGAMSAADGAGHRAFTIFKQGGENSAAHLKRSLERNTTLGFGLAGLVLLVLGLLFFIGLNNYDKDIQMRGHSRQIVIVMSNALSTLKDAETGQRGYLLTGRQEYLEPYLQARPFLNHDFSRLKQLVKDNPTQAQQVQHLIQLSDAKMIELQKAIHLKQTEGSSAAVALMLTNRGKVLMDQIRVLGAQMLAQESKSIEERNVRLTWNANLIRALVVGGGLLIFALFYIMSRLIRTEMAARQKAEAAQAEHSRRLEDTNREMEAFTYSVSHDLRAPLRSIDGFSQIVVNQYGEQLDENGKRRLGYIRENAQRMSVLIDDLLNLSRINRSELKDEPVNISEIAHQVLKELQAEDPSREVQIEIKEGLLNHGDARLLRIAITNLLSNAWKFTGKVPHASIQVGKTFVNKQPVYFVKDNGAGFDMEYSNKLFGAFQRLHQMDEFPGTGVGLTTVQRILRRHNGKIWAEAAVNQGATFYFTLHMEV